MKFVSDIRLLLLGLWLGSAVFFIAVAQSAFAVLPELEMAGLVVNRTLSILNIGGLIIAASLMLTSWFVRRDANRLLVWSERFLLLVVAAACAVGQFVIGLWLSMVRTQIGRPIDDVPVDDPLRIQFNNLHEYSTWMLFAAMIAALLAFFIISNRRFGQKPVIGTDFDFQKDLKV
ncbi:MAG: DUF4149 domain-containing protein [Pyrinomonadaceae bacterium]